MCKLNHMPAISPERLLVAAVRERVSPSLADWMGSLVVRGGEIKNIKTVLKQALAQAERVERHCANRESEPAHV